FRLAARLRALASMPPCHTGDLQSDVKMVSRTARVFGVRSTEDSLRSIAQRALAESHDDETRAAAAELLAELDKLPEVQAALSAVTARVSARSTATSPTTPLLFRWRSGAPSPVR